VAYWQLFIGINTWSAHFLSIAAVTKIPRPPKEQRIDTIVESARKVFCAYGFEKGSIEDIAKEAGIAEGRSIATSTASKAYLMKCYVVTTRHSLTTSNKHCQALRVRKSHTLLIRRTLVTISEDRSMCGLRALYASQSDNKLPALSHDQNRRMAVLMANEVKAGMKTALFDQTPRQALSAI
jgi:hypothetical protein